MLIPIRNSQKSLVLLLPITNERVGDRGGARNSHESPFAYLPVQRREVLVYAGLNMFTAGYSFDMGNTEIWIIITFTFVIGAAFGFVLHGFF